MSSPEPRNLVEHAADAGITAITAYLAHHDAKVQRLLIVLDASDLPPGEQDCVSAGSGIEDPKEVIAMLAGHFIGAARAIGMQVELIPIATKPQG